MNRVWLAFFLVAFAAVSYVWRHPDIPGVPAVRHKAVELWEEAVFRVQQLTAKPSDKASDAKKQPKSKPRPAAPPKPTPDPAAEARQVTLHLRSGGVVSGELVSDTPEQVVLRWDYGEVPFARAEIAQLTRGRAGVLDVVLPTKVAPPAWPYRAPVAFKLFSGGVVEGEIAAVEGAQLLVRHTLESGGEIETPVALDQLDRVLLPPVDNKRTTQIRAEMQAAFPTMTMHEEGPFVIVTDSPAPLVKEYWRTVRQATTDLYVSCAPLVRGRRFATQQYLVIFDDWGRYIKHAADDGVPGWVVPGYFLPETKVLYMMNDMSDSFERQLYALLGEVRGVVDEAEDQVKTQVDARYHHAVEGQGSEIRQKFEQAFGRLRGLYRQRATVVLRHELTHALLHNLGVQTVIVSELPESAQEAEAKTRTLATGGDGADAMLRELLRPPHRSMRGANSWMVEGMAAYMEMEPPERVNAERAYDLRHVGGGVEKLLPLEFINTFRLGSFPGMASDAQLAAYAQSWALVHYLMTHHRKGFLAFVARLVKEPVAEADEVPALCQAIGLELPALEAAFRQHVAALPPGEPFWLEMKQIDLDLRKAFGQ